MICMHDAERRGNENQSEHIAQEEAFPALKERKERSIVMYPSLSLSQTLDGVFEK